MTLQTSIQRPEGEPVLESVARLGGAFAEESAYALDWGQRRIEVPLSTETRFFRIRGASRLELVSIEAGICTLRFEW